MIVINISLLTGLKEGSQALTQLVAQRSERQLTKDVIPQGSFEGCRDGAIWPFRESRYSAKWTFSPFSLL